MKIALAHDWLVNYAGSEQLLFYLHKLYPEAPIFTTLYNHQKVQDFSSTLIYSSWLQSLPGATNHHQSLIPLMPLAINWKTTDYDLIISDCSWAIKGITFKSPTKHLAIILTPTRYLWGFAGDTRANHWLARPLIKYLKAWDQQAAKKPTQLVAISQTVKKRIKKIYHRESIVVYPPVEIERFAEGANSRSPGQQEYFLSVGRLVSYKRIDLIIAAFNQLGWPLVIIGSGPEERKLKKMAGENITFLGNVDNQTRDLYLKHCRAFVFAADEDFGIGPVEAMACGRPVIALNLGGVTETVTEGISGLFFKDQTVKSLLKTCRDFEKESFSPKTIINSVQKFNSQRFISEIKDIVSEMR